MSKLQSNSPSNLLAGEKSPYLLQHKDNPIAWFPWAEKAFETARRENKPVFLSVGYSTCHWCHVMAHESFEDAEVADVLNEGFVSVKVDREERPDVDDVYMKALQSISGGGGWPMSVWLTPEGKPFFAGTYFPKYRLLQLLRRIGEIWKTEPAQLTGDGDRLLEAVAAQASEFSDEESGQADWEESLKVYISHFQFHYDEKFGGFGKAPKFPQTMNLMLMMRQDSKTGLNQAEAMVTGTLQNMIRGGVYDQLAGGCHRYSVDQKWLVPHFEKMLYDQALLAVTLIDASKCYGDPELARAARETLSYVAREMTDASGGFYSAQDADSFNPEKKRNEEGHYVTYGYEELEKALTSEELARISEVYGVKAQGDFEGRSILHLQESFDGTVRTEPLVQSAFAKMAKLRAARPQPHRDDKIIAAWNGWMIWAFARGAAAFGEAGYLRTAERAMRFVRENLWREGQLSRFWCGGQARGAGVAEDYASLIHACLELHQVNGDPELVTFALSLQDVLDRDFWDDETGGYFNNDGRDARLPLRTKDEYDGVTPSSNSMAVLNLVRLYLLTGEAMRKHKAERIIALLYPKFKKFPSSLAYLGLAIDALVSDTKIAVVNGKAWAKELRSECHRRFVPHVYWTDAQSGWPVAEGKAGAETKIYVCEEGRCLKPALSKSEAAAQLAQ